MSECCQPNETPSCQAPQNSAAPVACPKCGRPGKVISVLTIKHQVKPALLSAVNAGGFRFCASADCCVVYYATGGRVFTVDDLRQSVTQKTRENPPLCYCFGFDEAMLREEIRASGSSTIPDRVTAEVHAGHCACEIRNPQGSCCLGNIKAAVARATAAAH